MSVDDVIALLRTGGHSPSSPQNKKDCHAHWPH